MKKYARYMRKSRFDRDYAELSVEETLKRHETILDNLAMSGGYHVVKSYYEVVSGESIAARPEIQKLLEEVNAGLYDGVLVVDVERLARGNSADQAYISQIFKFSGTKIITPSRTYDPSDEYDEEYFEFGLFMSRREYKTIVRRLVRGRESSASEGKYLGSIAPYGYERFKLPKEKGWSLLPHPEEAAIVKQIFHLWLSGRGSKEICNILNDNGVPTRHGDLWSPTSLRMIIRNPVYMGKIKRDYCRTTKVMENGAVKAKITHEKSLSNLRLFEGRHEALISEADFMLAQEIADSRTPATKVKKEQTLENAFAGLIFCSKCGRRVARSTLSKKRENGRARLKCIQQRNCCNGSAYYDIVEQRIILALREWLDGYRVKIDSIGFSDDIAKCNQRIKKIDQEIGKVRVQLDNAYNLVEQGVYTLDIFRQRQGALNATLEELEQQRIQAEQLLSEYSNNEATRCMLIPQTERLLASYEDMTIQERNDLLKTILHRIEYTKDKGGSGQIIIDLYPRLPRLPDDPRTAFLDDEVDPASE